MKKPKNVNVSKTRPNRVTDKFFVLLVYEYSYGWETGVSGGTIDRDEGKSSGNTTIERVM